MEVATFAEIEPEFLARISKMVWCNVATVDRQGRPRSRILHPIWEGPVGWIATNPQSHKAQHFTQNPYVSLAYIADVAKPVYADCRVEWVNDPAVKARVWELIKAIPEPLGYDPAPIFEAPNSAKFGLLRLTPWRIEIYNFPAANQIWRPISDPK